MEKNMLSGRFLTIFAAIVLSFLSADATTMITGWICDSNDDDVSGATVNLLDANNAILYTTTADRWGEYELELGTEGLAGSYTLTASAPGYVPATMTVELSEGAGTLRNQDFRLKGTTARISGFVADASASYAKYIDGAEVSISLDGTTIDTDESDRWMGYSLTVPDADPGKSYLITVTKEDFDTLTKEISLTPGEDLDLTIRLYPAGTSPKPVSDTKITGTVKSDQDLSAIAGATLSLKEGEESLGTATTDDGGSFELLLKDRVLSGEYTLAAEAKGYTSAEINVQITDGVSEPVNIRLSEEVRSSSLTVSVTDENNRMLSGVKGTLKLGEETVATAVSGWGVMEFEIEETSEDPYTLTLELEGYIELVASDITLHAGEACSLSYKMEKAPGEVTATEVKGKTVDKASGTPLSGVRVALARGDEILDYEYTDALGEFTITVKEELDGEFALSTRLSGYAVATRTVQITAGVCDEEDIVLEMEKQFTTVAVRAVDDKTGEPLPDVAVKIEEHYDVIASGTTDADGVCNIEFAAQEDTEYAVMATCRKYKDYSLTTAFNFGEVNSLEIRMVSDGSGLDCIGTDSGTPDAIFNLHGQPVRGHTAPGVYVVVRDGRYVKILK